MAEAERSGNPAFLMAAHHLLGVCLEFAGDMVESSRILDRGRELHDPNSIAPTQPCSGSTPA